jgi:U3 small nucleolar RNA-associated protein 15
VISGSDDKTVRVWDISTGQPVRRFSDHTDYVRCAATTPTSSDTFISGSYDHTIKLWDIRTKGGCSTSFDHGDPVEAVIVIPGGGVCLSAGGNTIKAWDMLGGKMMHSFSNHQKTVTSLSLDYTGSRIISASLDGLVKIYDVATYKVVHGMKYNTPLLSVALSPENKLLVAGTSDGTLCTRKRDVKIAEQMGHASQTLIRTGSASYHNRGRSAPIPANSVVVQTGKKVRLRPYDKALKAFKYQEALDLALDTRQPLIVISMLEELSHRQAISIALTGRNEVTLEPILKFLSKYLCVPNYTPVLMEVCGIIIDMYTKIIGQSITVDELFKKLESTIRKEVTLQQKLLCMVGCLDTIMAASVLAQGKALEE